jgi:hypothetical protein
MGTTTYSSPNRMVWEYFQALRRMCARVQQSDIENEIRQDAALCVILAVNGVEIFLNVYFRILVSKSDFKSSFERIITDLRNKVGIDIKIRDWPEVVLGEKIDLGAGVGQRFVELKNKRNRLTHFSSSHETIEVPGTVINGLADTSIYDSIDKQMASNALNIAEQFICEIFRLSGLVEQKIPHALHSWTGKVPNEVRI